VTDPAFGVLHGIRVVPPTLYIAAETAKGAGNTDG